MLFPPFLFFNVFPSQLALSAERSLEPSPAVAPAARRFLGFCLGYFKPVRPTHGITNISSFSSPCFPFIIIKGLEQSYLTNMGLGKPGHSPCRPEPIS